MLDLYKRQVLFSVPCKAFDVLGDPVRRRILELLADGEQSAGVVSGVIWAEFGISQPAVSQAPTGAPGVRVRDRPRGRHPPPVRRRLGATTGGRHRAEALPPVLESAHGRVGHRTRARPARTPTPAQQTRRHAVCRRTTLLRRARKTRDRHRQPGQRHPPGDRQPAGRHRRRAVAAAAPQLRRPDRGRVERLHRRRPDQPMAGPDRRRPAAGTSRCSASTSSCTA